MDESTVEEALRERLYNFYCELGWDVYSAEALAESIEIPTAVLDSFWLDYSADYNSCMDA